MEWETMRNHAQMGAGLLASHESLMVQLAASIAIREQYKDLTEDSIQQQSIVYPSPTAAQAQMTVTIPAL